MSCDHRTHFIERREDSQVILCEDCGTQLMGWQMEVRLPFFLLEQADEAHAMWHLAQERGEQAPEEKAPEPA